MRRAAGWVSALTLLVAAAALATAGVGARTGSSVRKVVRVRGLCLVDAKGRLRAKFAKAEKQGVIALDLLDSSGRDRAALGLSDEGNAQCMLWGAQSQSYALLNALPPSGAGFFLSYPSGQPAVSGFARPSAQPGGSALLIGDTSSSTRALVTVDEDSAAWAGLAGREGLPFASVYVGEDSNRYFMLRSRDTVFWRTP